MSLKAKRTLKFFWKHSVSYKKMLVLMLFTLVVGVSVNRFIPLVYRSLVDTIVAGTDDLWNLFKLVIYIVALELFGTLFWRLCAFLNNRFQPGVMSKIYNYCFKKLHFHSYAFFNNNFTGALVKKINRIVRAFEAIADRIYWDLLPLVIAMLVILTILTYVHWVLGLIMIVWTVIFVIATYFISNFKIKYDLKKVKADTKVTASLADTITNSTNIKLFSGLFFERNKFRKVTKNWFNRTKKAWDMDSIIEGVQALLMIILEGVIIYAAILLWDKGYLSVGDFVLIQLFLIDVFIHLWELGRIIRSLYENFADAEEMINIINKPIAVKDKRGAKKLIVHHGGIEFDDVNFSYDQGKEIMKSLSFKIKPSEKIALIGPSGGGKSTIAKLLLRLFDVNDGQILVDGQDISKVKQDSLRERIGMVPQDPILFHRTLMENIRYGRRGASDREVKAAAKMAHCDSFIEKFPDKYETLVGERGVKLSGGERQRIAIARAILSNAKILILDEATSQLDSGSEHEIQAALENLIKNKTTLIIAHRLSTIMQVDRIFVLKDGEVVEEGQHSELVAEKGSLYKKLWDLQVGGYLGE